MPRFLIERNFCRSLEVTKEDADQVRQINDEEGVKWLSRSSARTSERPIASMRPRMPRRSASPPKERTYRPTWSSKVSEAETREIRLTNPRADRRQGGVLRRVRGLGTGENGLAGGGSETA